MVEVTGICQFAHRLCDRGRIDGEVERDLGGPDRATPLEDVLEIVHFSWCEFKTREALHACWFVMHQE
jgi:hypothetical protein